MTVRSKEIALLIDYNNNYDRSIVEGVARYSSLSGWRFYTSRGVPSISERVLKSWNGAGVIGRLSPAMIDLLGRRKIPTVNIKYDYAELPACSVLMDNVRVGREAAEFFLGKGFSRFACTAWSIKGVSGGLKLKGFTERLQEDGFDAVELKEQAAITNFKESVSFQQGQGMAVFAAEDFLGRMVIESCRSGGLRVPEDVAVLGVDNSPFICEMLQPTMSSFELGAERIGYQAASLLDQLIQGRKTPNKPVLVAPERIVERHSTDILQVEDQLVANALRFIQEHAAEPVTVGNVTDALHCNRRVLEKRFKAEVGRTLHEEIRRARVLRACHLLRETDMLVEVLAEACGYCSRERFNAAFRRETGQTPSAYRREHRFAKHP